MKALRYIAVIVFLILVVAAGFAHIYRNSLVRDAANAALESFGLTVTELSIESISADAVRFSTLALEQGDGTHYEISELTYPLNFSGASAQQIVIEQLVLTPADSTAPPTPLAPLMRTLLQLPGEVQNTQVTVGRLATAGFPPAHDLVWRTENQRQQLAFRVESIDVTLEVDRLDDASYRATVNAMSDDHPSALALLLEVHRSDSGVTMTGDVTVSTSPWVPVLKAVDLLPVDVVVFDAELAGPVSIELRDSDAPTSHVSARLSLTNELNAHYGVTDALTARLRGTAPAPLAATLEYPSLEWTADINQIDIRVGTDSIPDIPMRLNNLKCRTGIRCAVSAAADTGPIEFGTLTIANVKLAAPLTISMAETTLVNVAPDAALTLTGVALPALAVAVLETTQPAGAILVVDDDGWHMDVERLNLRINTATDREGLLASGLIQLKALNVRDRGATVNTEMSIQPGAASVSWDGTNIVVPGVAGKLSLRGGLIEATTELAEGDALSARVQATHNIETGAGTAVVRDATLRFDADKLSSRLVKWPYAWDVVAGSWITNLELSWKTGSYGVEYAGKMTHKADKLAGIYKDTAFAGFNTMLSLDLDSTAGIAAAPASLEIELIDVGLPLEKIAADYVLDIGNQVVTIDKLSLSTLGGRITADPFRFGLQEQRNDITLRPQSIQLPFIMSLVDFEDIELSGSISGVIPVTVSDMQLSVTNGKLASDPPGGVIRYRPGSEQASAGTSNSPLDLVSRALANFQFESLVSDVDYNEAGDLLLQMKLSGINPDMDDKQPVILNLSIDNNIPQLMRSLRAARSIEDILARKTIQ